jgi:uncharacterized GH25 family protein
MAWNRKLLLNRFVLVPATIAIIVALWNVYIAFNAGGIVKGRVVDQLGHPVPGATVRMMEQNFTTNSERGVTRTDTDGRFEFFDNRSHNIQLSAEKEGMGRSKQKVVRLYFRAQNVALAEPLILAVGKN